MAVGGEIHRASGLGEGARLMLAGLAQLGVPHWGMQAGLSVPGEEPVVAEPCAIPPPGVPLLLHVNAPQLPPSLLRLPRALIRGRMVIGHWAWELPVLPPGWRVGFEFVHRVWAPSRFTAAALETMRPPHMPPVRVVPYPVAANPPQPAALDRQAFGLPVDTLVTLASFSLASSFERKNPIGAIAAHRLAFGDRMDRLLLLKLANTAYYDADLQKLRHAIGDAPNIRLETRTFPIADSHALTRACDIVLSLHRSEGFGLVPAEAMLLERPVVATGWSGNMDFMDADCAALVDYRLVEARDSRSVFEVKDARWAEPDLVDAARWLTRLADDAALRQQLGARGKATALARLGTEPLAAALRDIGR
jgi:glycosyltransferase involved in cell wall biosynthesis